MVTMGAAGDSTFSTRGAARILAIPPARIRNWVKRELIRPTARRGRNYRFGFNDLLLMRSVKEVARTRRHLEPLRQLLSRACSLLTERRPLTAMRLSNRDGRIVVRDGDLCFEAESGQMLLSFGPDDPAGKLEDGFGPARARARFEEVRRVAERDPLRAIMELGDGAGRPGGQFGRHVRLASMSERRGDLDAALRHLLGAASMAPADVNVHLRLGLLYRRRREYENAVASFRRALECDPASAESHQNLADLYSRMGRRRDADRHLRALGRLT